MTGISALCRSWLLATVIAVAVADQYTQQLENHRVDEPLHLAQQDLQTSQQEEHEKLQQEVHQELQKSEKEIEQFERDLQQAQLELDKSPQNLQVHHNQDQVTEILKRLRRQAEQRRHRRDYIQWYGSTTTFQQPNYVHSYQINSQLPYFIPVWGNPRRIPIFFPSKPILLNPGYPARNPPRPKPFEPSTEPPVTEDGSPITIGSRINVNAEGEPIWGIVEPSNTLGGAARPTVTSQGTPTGSGAPPRVPPPSGSRPTRPPTPPLLHRPTGGNTNNAPGLGDRDIPNLGQPTQQFPQTRPQQEIPQTRPQQQIPPVIQFRPQTTVAPPTRPTAPPRPTTTIAPQGREEPPRCVWAIISCCNPTNTQISYSCFEQLGCPGAFWDSNPCSRENTAAALNTAAKFYEQR